MPLLALLGQLTSMCSSKSRNFLSVTMFEPAALLTREPRSTIQLEAFEGLSKCQPLKSRPLNSLIRLPDLGLAGESSTGARLPVHFQCAPSGPLAVPLKFLPVNLPSKIRSVLLPSSAFGETK